MKSSKTKTSNQHSGRLSDADYYALVNAVTSRYDCDKIGRGIVDRDGMRAEFDRVLNGLFEQKESLDEALREILDICEGWTRKLHDDEKLTFIKRAAESALSNPATKFHAFCKDGSLQPCEICVGSCGIEEAEEAAQSPAKERDA